MKRAFNLSKPVRNRLHDMARVIANRQTVGRLLKRQAFHVLLLTWMLLLPVAGWAQQTETRQIRRAVLDEVAQGLSELLKEATGNRRPAVRAARPGAVAPAMAAPAEVPADEKKRRQARLTAYSDAMLLWLTSVCGLSAEQQQQAEKIAEAKAKKVLQKWAGANPRAGGNQLSPAFPVKFTSRSGGADNIDLTRHDRELIDQVLTVEQVRALSEATEERLQFQRAAVTDRVLNLLDEQLFLSEEQRQSMRGPLQDRLNGMETTSFSLLGQSYYYPQQSISFVLKRGAHLSFLTAPQKQRAESLASIGQQNRYNGEQYLLFESSAGPESWQKQLEQHTDQQRKRIQQACIVRVEYYRMQWGLPEKSARLMKIAAKGVTDSIVADWKKTTRQHLKRYEEQAGGFGGGGNFSFSLQVASVDAIDTNRLWTHTVQRVRPDPLPSTYDRAANIQQAQAHYLTALLDRELWLLPDQRPDVQSLVLKALSKSGRSVQLHSYMQDVALLVVPLAKFSKRDASVFNDAQEVSWNQLKEHFNFDGRQAWVAMQNGGRLQFVIP